MQNKRDLQIFRPDPFFSNSIIALWLMMFMAHAVFHCFHRRNLKPQWRKAHTAVYFAALIAAGLRTDNWWPPPPT